MATEAVTPAPEPWHGFEDSRRLTGPNRWFAGTAVTLTPLGPAAADATAHERWAALVRRLCVLLAWPEPMPRVAGGALVFAAPEDTLFTATDLNEWAWEQAADTAAAGFDTAQPLGPDEAGAAAVLAARAAAESRADVQALRQAARAHGLPVFVDDEHLSLGTGSGSRCWPLEALPAPHDVPWAALHDRPTVLVTGSNGKTTTVRLLAAMAAAAGLTPGHCCTEGVVVGGQTLQAGDYAGPAGARAVLRHPAVQVAILETARGGILRRGLALRRADVAVITNISEDHLGEYGVRGAADLAETKLAVAHALHDGGTLVLNADDATLMAAAARWAPAPRRALFAAAHEHPALAAHRAAGGSSCGVREGVLLLAHGGALHPLGEVAGLPLTWGGSAQHNVANASAAALAAACLGWPLAAITDTLHRFGTRPHDNPGRLERWAHRGATVLIDYAHNPDGLARLLAVAQALQPRRLGLLLGQAGNRDDQALAALARVAASAAPERVLIKELPQMLRGRQPGEVPALLQRGLLAAGLPAERVMHEPDEEAAALALLHWAEPGDVLVLPVHTRAVRERLVARLAAHQAAAAPG